MFDLFSSLVVFDVNTVSEINKNETNKYSGASCDSYWADYCFINLGDRGFGGLLFNYFFLYLFSGEAGIWGRYVVLASLICVALISARVIDELLQESIVSRRGILSEDKGFFVTEPVRTISVVWHKRKNITSHHADNRVYVCIHSSDSIEGILVIVLRAAGIDVPISFATSKYIIEITEFRITTVAYVV